MRKMSISVLLVAALLVSGPLFAKKKKKPAPKADFSYYLLALSWAPEFCAQHGSQDPGECGVGKKFGFVVHGLWPQGENGRGPENCGSASPVSQSIVQVMLNYLPTASLIQHEWKTHGTCSGLSVADYFAAVRKVRDGLKIPDEFKAPAQALNLGPAAIESAFAAANPTYPKEAFRTYCNVGALQEARVCFDKDLSPRACTVSAGECSVPSIKVPPVR